MEVANSQPGMPYDDFEGIIHVSVRLRGLPGPVSSFP